MAHMKRICKHCDQSFLSHPSVPKQQYCGKIECQRGRKRQRQKERLISDQDYRDNQQAAQKAWRERNPEYMPEYRKNSPKYVEMNRVQQRERNRSLRNTVNSSPSNETSMIVNMDELHVDPVMHSGKFRVVFQKAGMIVKMDELFAHLIPVSDSSTSASNGLK
jgi:hypothetical protein